jgi:hypothetical protein
METGKASAIRARPARVVPEPARAGNGHPEARTTECPVRRGRNAWQPGRSVATRGCRGRLRSSVNVPALHMEFADKASVRVERLQPGLLSGADVSVSGQWCEQTAVRGRVLPGAVGRSRPETAARTSSTATTAFTLQPPLVLSGRPDESSADDLTTPMNLHLVTLAQLG